MDQCLAQEKFLWTFPRLATNQKIYIIFFTGACTQDGTWYGKSWQQL